MPKDTTKNSATEMGAAASSELIVQKTARKASTLAEMWGRNPSVSLSAKVSKSVVFYTTFTLGLIDF